jgi:hypothetical protein
MSNISEETRKQVLDKAVLALLIHDVSPYSQEKWADVTADRKAYHYTDPNPLDVDIEMLFVGNSPERILQLDRQVPQVTSPQAYQGGEVDRRHALNTLGEQTQVLGKALNKEYGLPHADYVVLNLVANNAGFNQRTPFNPAGQLSEDRNPSHLVAVMTAEAHKKLAVEMLKRMAEPKAGAAMFDMDADDYKNAFKDGGESNRPKRAVEQVISKAAFNKDDGHLLDEVMGVAKLHNNNDFGVLIATKKRVLPAAQATHVGRAIAGGDGEHIR